MLLRAPTTEELQRAFKKVLNGIVKGTMTGCPTDTGLDQQTVGILNLLAAQPGKKKPSDIVACRIEFARMLDGTHAREDREQLRDLLLRNRTGLPKR